MGVVGTQGHGEPKGLIDGCEGPWEHCFPGLSGLRWAAFILPLLGHTGIFTTYLRMGVAGAQGFPNGP